MATLPHRYFQQAIQKAAYYSQKSLSDISTILQAWLIFWWQNEMMQVESWVREMSETFRKISSISKLAALNSFQWGRGTFPGYISSFSYHY